jgi:two-component system nitrogen regulation sensor histidine kinase NtrY
MLTLMILVGSTWMGLYLAKRITRPVQMLAVAANEIGAGHFDYRVEAETRDEFGSLIDAFNRMASDLSASRRRLERSAIELEQKHHDVEGRRRYVETILQRIATGVVSVDTAGKIRTMNAAASRLLGVGDPAAGQAASTVFGSPELSPLATVMDEASLDGEDALPQEVSITRGGRDIHLAVMTTSLRREDGVSDGVVLVLEDVTPLIRAQRVAAWREVARRLAHEIKNPLTPIRLCAERMQRHFTGAPAPTQALVDECTATIVGEVKSLKNLVDEFSQFARMPSPRTVPTDIHALLADVFALYRGIFTAVDLRPRFATTLPLVSVDPEQIRRVVINLVDNAVEAMAQHGAIDVETHHVPAENVVRIVVADNGPGIPPAEREKLFLPHYSTKQRGSGLGLAIVRRIVTEHGGSVTVTENVPHGTRFVIELPC